MKICLKIFVFFVMLCTLSFSKGVSAGTPIVNVAQLKYKINGSDFNSTSNTLVDLVDQIVDFDILCQDTSNVIVENGQTAVALTFQLSNVGNGTDKFTLLPETNATSDFSVSNPRLYIDSNGNGVFDISVDQQVNDVNLSEDVKATLFFVSDMPTATFPSGSLSANGMRITSDLASGLNYGESKNIGSYFVVNGIVSGSDKALCQYEMRSLELVLAKSATLSSDKLFTGTIIHYKIKVSALGVGTINNVVVHDTIPIGTSYVPNSLQLDGTNLSDSTHLTGTTISVPIGDIVQSNSVQPTHFVTFDVKVD
ncbi:MAG TPA: hypothetical protein ENK39_01905 [Epsilonproteobacteria bacterium]|nr:hypothetical protein [Campylobacterota bacterium]